MATKPFKWADAGGTQFQTNSPTDSQYNPRPKQAAAGTTAAAQVLAGEATELESAGLDPMTGFEMFRKRKTTGGGTSAAAAMLGA